ncbi:MAG TPA: putative glycolipid-binding domain-containing protein [Pyrinomonadaceae bacterium]
MKEFLRSIIWRRLDIPGHEWAQASADESESRLYGTAIFVYDGEPCCLEYLIECDSNGETITAEVVGEVGDEMIEIEISVDDDHKWTMNGRSIEAVNGCVDIDLNFSPVTNTLPIRRLDLAVGESREVSAAWLRFPSFALEPFQQTYTRISEHTFRYESANGTFQRDLTVDEHGIVTDYPSLWIEEKG